MNLCTGGRHIEKEVLGKGTVLNAGEDLLHGLLGFVGDVGPVT